MNIFVLTDLEGISGVDSIDDLAGENYRHAQERLMADTNAVIKGLFEAGADKVFVEDGHGGGHNFLEDRLDPRAAQAVLNPDHIDLTNIDAFICVGYHAMAGTADAFLDHTQSSVAWHNYYINGKPQGELGQVAVYGGIYGIPVIMTSGDETYCKEASALIPGIIAVPVKKALGRNRAVSIPDAEAEDILRSAAAESLSLINTISPYTEKLPLEIILEFNRTDYLENSLSADPSIERLDARTLRRIADKVVYYEDLLF